MTPFAVKAVNEIASLASYPSELRSYSNASFSQLLTTDCHTTAPSIVEE